MADVRWIKITTNMFDDEKIDFIESLPEADGILVVWMKLLTMAGRCNAGGYVFLTENIPYTTEMLSHKFRRPLNTVKLAMETLKRLKMIEFDGELLRIANWDKHQNIDGMDKIREQTRIRVEKHRSKLIGNATGNVTSNVTVTDGNATDKEEEIEKEIELEKEKEKEVKTNMSDEPAVIEFFSEKTMVKEVVPAEKPCDKQSGAESHETCKDKLKNEFPEDFLKFWSSYPRKMAREKAFRQWKLKLKSRVSPEDLIKAAENYALDKNATEEKFIMLPATFLGPDDRYKDYVNFTPLPPPRLQNKPVPSLSTRNIDTRGYDYDDLERKLREKALSG